MCKRKTSLKLVNKIILQNHMQFKENEVMIISLIIEFSLTFLVKYNVKNVVNRKLKFRANALTK